MAFSHISRTLTPLLFLCLIFVESPAQTARSFNAVPFDTTVERLPPNYLGHSLGDLIGALGNWNRTTQKSEFETTPEYYVRLEKMKQRPLVGAIKFNSLLAISISGNENGQLSASYDADLGIMTVALKMNRDLAACDYDHPCYSLLWVETSRKIASYVGRNAFNRSVRVQAYRNDELLIGLLANGLEGFTELRTGEESSLRSYGIPEREKSISFSLVMGAKEAQAAKPQLTALIIGHLADNPYYHTYERDTPEIDDPFDRHNHKYLIKFVPQEIWIYNYSTGLVYARRTSLDSTPGPETKERQLPYSTSEIPTNSTDYSRTFSPREVSQQARIIARPEPQYTPEAKKNQVAGTVVLRAVFSSSGQVTNIRVVSGLPHGLTEQAIAVAKQIRFSPAMKDGRAVSQHIQIEYNFNLY